ncbi:hypothetical protein KZZ52_29685 [Dactylosporangium sp. AC04546]|uniref:hypothetical protein n=1 Tax=Dactylosporangium sp. AC04546 TaxID=2862460 RepID=UPI001EDFE20F|nr:hypothetical protein [Dactylosporangium sp. AC04546]WVK78170.1 hypothetical protein KZZ52_29685 [Dactylosporangium sp. AC04546]
MSPLGVEEVLRLAQRLADLCDDRELRRLVHDVRERLAVMVHEPGDPVALWHAADRWSSVAATVGRRGDLLGADTLRADNRWSGPAADAYLQGLPTQRAAFADAAGAASAVATALRDLAVALGTFWAALGVAVSALAARLAAAVAGCAVPLAVPAAAAAGTAALAEFLAVAGLLLGNLHETAGRLLRDPPDPRWPALAGPALADGSMTDGNGSGWRLRY